MELNDLQKSTVAEWVEQGLGLSDIQKKLESEFDLKMTYMDVRFLVLDLQLEIQDAEPPAPKPDAVSDGASDPAGDPTEPGGGVSVEIDRVVKAGAAMSGTAVFSDGVRASWAVDNMGRLVLDAGDREDYRPSEEDIQSFQLELKKQMSGRGY